jgi:hypothetical protein
VSRAAAKWKALYDEGRIQDDEALGRYLEFFLTLEETFEDGSILRWNESEGRWRFYDDPKDLAWDKKLGRASVEEE